MIEKYLKKNKKTVYRMANDLDMSIPALQYIIKNKSSKTTVEMALKISVYTGLKITDFINGLDNLKKYDI